MVGIPVTGSPVLERVQVQILLFFLSSVTQRQVTQTFYASLFCMCKTGIMKAPISDCQLQRR